MANADRQIASPEETTMAGTVSFLLSQVSHRWKTRKIELEKALGANQFCYEGLELEGMLIITTTFI